jgi:phosphoglycolate phosphatase-like HAD superfamily hydrolase
LFDIDGTLLRGATDAHRDAVHEALRDVYGVADPGAAHVAPAGRTDREIARQILLGSGVSAQRIDEGMDDFRQRCAQHYARLCPSTLAQFVIDGVPELLEHLSDQRDVRLSLVTGNLEPIARLKLARAGIGSHFPHGQGGFGSDAEDRSDLPAVARTRAGHAGAPHPRERTLVIGDTPRDIACAHADGVGVLAVATGPYRADQLTAADAVARDTGELAGLIEARAQLRVG